MKFCVESRIELGTIIYVLSFERVSEKLAKFIDLDKIFGSNPTNLYQMSYDIYMKICSIFI